MARNRRTPQVNYILGEVAHPAVRFSKHLPLTALRDFLLETKDPLQAQEVHVVILCVLLQLVEELLLLNPVLLELLFDRMLLLLLVVV